MSMNDDYSIAIIGMSVKLPGADSIDEFWGNLVAGKESIAQFKPEELLSTGIPRQVLENKNYVSAKGVVNDIDKFDANFFEFNEIDSISLDPQQRIFLECSWQALEHAGYCSEQQAGRVGVFAGIGLNMYYLQNILTNREIIDKLGDYHTYINNHNDQLAMRVAYKFNLTGPAYCLQSACSTSLLTVSAACQNLNDFQCDMALAGGVSLPLPVRAGYLHQEGMIFSSDGHCRAFAKNADGTVPGMGCGVVVLKRTQEALRDNDHIYAIIKGFAVNNDGKLKASYTAPNSKNQASCIIEAMSMADIEPESIGYIETHGTGTKQGDLIEIAGLKYAFNAVTCKNSCALGSVKTNLGHLDAAAGIASLIKTALCLHHKTLVPSLYCEHENPQLALGDSPFYINKSVKYWEPTAYPRRAGISSFGVGGTNVHLTLEESHVPSKITNRVHSQLIVLSAKSHAALESTLKQLQNFIIRHPTTHLQSLAYTLQVGRNPFNYRSAFFIESETDLANEIALILDNQLISKVKNPEMIAIILDDPDLTLQQTHESILSIIHEHSGIKNFLSPLDDFCKNYFTTSIKKCLFTSNDSRADAPAFPASKLTLFLKFVLQYLVLKLLIHCNAIPLQFVTTGIGECVALVITDVISLTDMLQFLFYDCTIQLPPDIKISNNVTIFSLHNGKNIDANLLLAKHYWQDTLTNKRSAFLDGHLSKNPIGHDSKLPKFLSLNPKDTLLINFTSQFDDHYLNSKLALAKYVNVVKNNPTKNLIPSIAKQTWLHGRDICWDKLYAKANRIPLPTYPFERKRYWLEANPQQDKNLGINSDIESYLFVPIWRKLSPQKIKDSIDNCVLLIHYDDEFSCAFKAALCASGASILELKLTKHTASSDATLATQSTKYLTQLLSQTNNLAAATLKICYLPSSNINNFLQLNISQYKNAYIDFFSPLIELTKILNQQPLKSELYLFSYNAQEIIGHDLLNPGQAMSASLANVINLEYKNVHCKNIDIDIRQATQKQLDTIANYFAGNAFSLTNDNLIAYRNGDLWLRSFTAFRSALQKPQDINKNDTFIITGGLGGLGYKLAETLAADYNCHLILIGRTRLNSQQDKLLNFVLKDCRQQFPSHIKKTSILNALLDKIVAHHLIQFLNNVFSPNCPTTKYSKAKLIELLSPDNHGMLIINLIIRILTESRMIDEVDDSLHIKNHDLNEDLLRQELLSEFPESKHMLELLQHCVNALPDIIKNTTSAISVLYPKNNNNLIELAHDSLSAHSDFNACTKHLAIALQQLSISLCGKTINILEVGGGSGFLTYQLLSELTNIKVNYVFTDISQAIVNKIKAMPWAASNKSLTFNTLDISKDPTIQGYELGSFDVILAFNVIHTTTDLSTTLNNLKRLLIPNGILAILESVKAHYWSQLIWGLLPSWWNFTSDNTRSHSPLLSTEGWLKLLRNHDLQNIKTYPNKAQLTTHSNLVLFMCQNKTSSTDAIVENKNLSSKLELLRKHANSVNYYNLDVTSQSELEQFASNLCRQNIKIKAIIHAAAIPGGGLLHTSTMNAAFEEFKPKAYAANLLINLTKNLAPDCIILCSSLNSMVGGFGQFAYSTSNALLDALAHYYSTQTHVSVKAINWCRWQGVGMSDFARRQQQAIFGQHQSDALTENEGKRAFKYALQHIDEFSQLCISKADITHLQNKIIKLYSTLHQQNSMVHPLEYESIAAQLIKIWQHVFNLETVTIHDDFFALGGDSLLAVQITHETNKQLNCGLQVQSLLDLSSIEKLSQHIFAIKQQANTVPHCSNLDTDEIRI